MLFKLFHVALVLAIAHFGILLILTQANPKPNNPTTNSQNKCHVDTYLSFANAYTDV
jgi:hypothetical protein